MRVTGIEPAHLAAREPKSRASASSATPACYHTSAAVRKTTAVMIDLIKRLLLLKQRLQFLQPQNNFQQIQLLRFLQRLLP